LSRGEHRSASLAIQSSREPAGQGGGSRLRRLAKPGVDQPIGVTFVSPRLPSTARAKVNGGPQNLGASRPGIRRPAGGGRPLEAAWRVGARGVQGPYGDARSRGERVLRLRPHGALATRRHICVDRRYDDPHRRPRQNDVVPVAATAPRSARIALVQDGRGAQDRDWYRSFDRCGHRSRRVMGVLLAHRSGGRGRCSGRISL
jgi:hypothetical protein